MKNEELKVKNITTDIRDFMDVNKVPCEKDSLNLSGICVQEKKTL